VDHFPEPLGIFDVNPPVVLPGFKVGGQALNHILGVHEDSDWLVGGYRFQGCYDCSYLAYLV